MFDYNLPEELIGKTPPEPRDSAKMLVMDRKTGKMEHKVFRDLTEFLEKGDALVLNNSKVFPARLIGKKETGGQVEALLFRELSADTWRAMSSPRILPNKKIDFGSLKGEVLVSDTETGFIDIRFSARGERLRTIISDLGRTPLPPYIKNKLSEEEVREKYQTVYARALGSSAAPTAGMHFTEELLEELKEKGVKTLYVTLHVGPGTFAKLREENILKNELHEEEFEISEETAQVIMATKAGGGRVVAVGTTTTRALESAYTGGHLKTGRQATKLFINPPYKFKVVDSLITNFHLPKSSLLMMVAAFCTAPNTETSFVDFKSSIIGKAYKEATALKYHFFSFGDAMLII